ncbi:MAG: DinB family protein [Phycisphaerae bacterium]|nr:DinB family protein [Phycisphaerae bacterium]
MQVNAEPRLAPPGAGLPLPELLVARVLFRLRRARGTPASFTADITDERARIAAILDATAPDRLGVRVLIPRLRGLEDSSRHWSVWMTLDHLRRVHEGVAGVMRSLSNGIVPPGATSTADVKPSPAVDGSIRVPYERSCDTILAAIAEANPASAARYAHPWFGPLDVRGWHALVGMHLRIHRRQTETILGAPATRG